MARRKKWKAPNNPTAAAKQVWAAVYPHEPWPKGWTVAWAGFMRNAAGLAIYGEKRILLSYADAKKPHPEWGAVRTLVHEFIHARCGYQLRHGKEFRRLEQAALARIGLGS